MSRPDFDEPVDSVALNLNYAGITDLGEINAVKNHPDRIKYLFLKRNRLKFLSLVDHQMSNLLELVIPLENCQPHIYEVFQCSRHLEGNNLQCLSDEIGELKHLQLLDVVSNQLTSLPASIGQLVSLNTLAICNNQIQTLPKEIGKLRRLRTLEATRNKLTSLPTELCGCLGLSLLALDRNLIQKFPRQLCWLPNLKDLSLAGNQIEYLPPVILHTLTQLDCVNLKSNYNIKALPSHNSIIHLDTPSRKPMDGRHTYAQSVKVDNEQYPVPQEFDELCNLTYSCVPCLQELAMREIHRSLYHKNDAGKLMIPTDLQDNMMYPTAFCLQCGRSLFKSGFPVIYREPDCRLPTMEFCCSRYCVLTYNFDNCRVKYPALPS